jgi:hypothetical protein
MSDNLATGLAGVALAILAVGMIIIPRDPYLPSIGAVLVIVLVLVLLQDRDRNS